MDQTPRDLPPRSGWDRATRRDDGSWSVLPILLVVALVVIGAWLLFAERNSPPTTTTSETAPATAPSSKPSPTPAPSATPTTPPSNSAPAPATKP